MGMLGRFIFWDFARGSWQYDVMVGLILAFIFITPVALPGFFHDQPKAVNVQMMGDENQYWLSAELLSGVPEAERLARAQKLVHGKFNTRRPVTRVKELTSDENEILGYVASTQP